MIYDCFPFFNELDLLEMRLNELDGVVDRFVVAEAELTHNGEPKKLYFSENSYRFKRFAGKIIHVLVTRSDFAAAEGGATFQERAWMRENIQRNAIALAIKDAVPDDVIMVSDIDEIPRAEKVRDAARSLSSGEVVGFALNQYNYFFNFRCVTAPVWGNDPKMSKVSTFFDLRTYASSHYEIFILPQVNCGATATRFRYVRPARRIMDAGWHFSYLGGTEIVVKKVKAFNETGLFERKDIEAYAAKCIRTGRSLSGADRFIADPLDDSFPSFLLENKSRFEHLVAKPHLGETRVLVLRNWYRTLAMLRHAIKWTLFRITPQRLRQAMKPLLARWMAALVN